MTAVHDSFVLTRRYPKPPARVFRALSDPGEKQRWYGQGEGHEGGSYRMAFAVGGEEDSRYVMGPGTPIAGKELASISRFLDIAADERVVMAQTMTLDGARMSVALISFELAAGDGGTVLTFTHHALFLEGADGPAMRRGGWEALLDRLGLSLA
ncbi:MAG: polyketide cyclase [Caulobacter sp.]|nr:polyketide cyclase [Caulobacter sp.]